MRIIDGSSGVFSSDLTSVVNTKNSTAIATKPAPQPGSAESTAACGKSGPATAPGSAWCRKPPATAGSTMLYMPVDRIMKAVALQTSSVSTYTANACTKPCCEIGREHV